MNAADDIAGLYAAHGHVVLRRARQILRDDAEAQDVLHEIFTTLLSKPARFQARSGVTTFLYSATTNLCLNRLRDRATRKRLLARQRRPQPVHARGDGVLQVQELLARLPDELAQVTVYYYVDEMTHEEIAEQVGCSRRQVGNLLERAMELCQRQAPREAVSHG